MNNLAAALAFLTVAAALPTADADPVDGALTLAACAPNAVLEGIDPDTVAACLAEYLSCFLADACGTPVCAEEYDDGVFTSWPCPPELCGLDQGTVAISAQGSGAAPIGTLTCHDDAHAPTGSLSTPPGSFQAGTWLDAGVGPISSGTHPHCNITAVNGATYAFAQCGKQ